MNDFSIAPAAALNDQRLAVIAESFQRLTGKALLDGSFDPQAMWDAPRAIVAHGTEGDPVFFYGNRLALQLFEMSFEEFAQLPSRLSADPVGQQARAALMAQVTQQGFVSGYSGERIAKSGRRFMIADVTIWNLCDADGDYVGQAATFIAPAAPAV
ncbi:MAG: MEKHLA domain-containing protein [Gallionella sp.]|nr:MEKHLA domain-containing protein [Gallionella sp.]MDD4946773.1 MEKHLA domain-containing protein [Gallionella sp.]MDD5612221.1 MEKHLA domain-containing protein [Gallionella sp.]